jgi:signal transduction histidine kinase
VTSSKRVWLPWARWSLARQLPLLTATIVVLVVSLSLTLTYSALLAARSRELHARLNGLLRVIVQTSEANTRQRAALIRQVAADSALARVLSSPGSAAAKDDSAARAALNKLVVATDSGLPVELWTTDGRRVAHIGIDVRGDSISLLPPEIRSLRGTRVSEIPTGGSGHDSVQFGANYASGGRVYLWVVGPVYRNGKLIGHIAQQRRIVGNAQIIGSVRELSGEDFTVYRRNWTDGFASTLEGRPIAAPMRRDSTADGFISVYSSGERRVSAEARVGGTSIVYVAEAPEGSLTVEPRATLRQIAFFSLLLLMGGVFATWALSRQITRPLVELTTAAEAIAQGDYARRVRSRGATSDEVIRLGASFNRMATEVEASHDELATQIEDATAVSEELAQTNLQLQHASLSADQSRDAALHANRAKSDFLAVMSHELRTPLNAIGGYVEILQIGIYGGVNDAQQNALNRIKRSQQTLLSLINDVLNFAKLEAGAVRYTMTDVALSQMLIAIEEFVSPQLHDRKLSYSLHVCPAFVTVQADSDKLQQVLINLLSNAIKYTAEGGSIDVRCDVSETQAHVHIHDTGIGIATDRLDKIFDPFIQVGRALNRPHDGVGLGLSISRDLARAMGGTLSVESKLGVGSTFSLTLERGPDLLGSD